jgi:UDP-N-acetylglucosamine 2-epimerase (non-hydrolysing)
MKKAALVVGARPQFIKTAPLINELGRFCQIVLIHTGQHYDFVMSDAFFKELALPLPDYHLETPGGLAGRQIGRMLEGLEDVLLFEKPDTVIVVGDTNSTLAGSVSAAKLGIPIAHIEAGVRSKEKNLPEQINRVITDSISDYYFCPTPSAVHNLAAEGKTTHVYDTGDVLYDCLRLFEPLIPEYPGRAHDMPSEFILVTLHRAEAVDNKNNLETILRSLVNSELPIIFPIHPRTRKMLRNFGLIDMLKKNIMLMNPLGYLDILSLIKQSSLVVTDSGGIQREAVFLKKAVLVARPETEWPELENSGWLTVCGYDFDLTGNFHAPKNDTCDLEYLFRPAAKSIAEILGGL